MPRRAGPCPGRGISGSLRGAATLLRESPPILVIEIQRQKARVLEVLASAGYAAFTPAMRNVQRPDDVGLNAFFFHRERHASLIRGTAS